MSIDFQKEIDEIKQAGEKRLYSKKDLDGKQRIKFSILAHMQGLVSMSVVEQKNSFLCISPPCNEQVPLTKEHYEFFGHLVNKHIGCAEDVHFYGLESKFAIYEKNLKECTAAGYKRYYEIMQEHLFQAIAALPKFKNTEKVIELKREHASKKPGIVFAPKNNGMYCVSVDVKSSVFQGYKELGVFEQENWEQFISLHTNDQLLIRSKNLRLCVFGRCNVFKNNQIIINNTITPTWNQIVATMPQLLSDLLFLSGDEAVFGYQDEIDASITKDRLLAMQFPSHIVITAFRLEQKFIEKNSYFLRHFTYPAVDTDIKAASPEIIRQATEELRTTK